MTNIEKRPIHSLGDSFVTLHGHHQVARWHYVFYVEIAGSVREPRVEAALGKMKQRTAFYRVLGSYKRDESERLLLNGISSQKANGH